MKATRQISYVKDGNELCLTDGQGNQTKLLVKVESEIASPIWSADGKKIAVYWIRWQSDGKRLLFLAGLPNVEFGGHVSVYGGYTLSSISASGADPVEIYSYPYVDVREACPDLSSDERYATLIAKPARGNQKVFIVAIDGSGWLQLTRDGRCSYPSWRPTDDYYE